MLIVIVCDFYKRAVEFKIADDKIAEIICLAFGAAFENTAPDKLLGGAWYLVDGNIEVRHIELIYSGDAGRRVAAEDKGLVV